MTLWKAKAKRWVQRLCAPLAMPLYGGVGSVLMFHRVVDDPPPERLGQNDEIETSSAMLSQLVGRLRRRYDFVGIDEMVEVLQAGKTRARRFLVVTFDDGYRDVHLMARPILAGLGVPFTLYLTSGFPDRTVIPWPQMLERLLLSRPRLELDLGNGGLELKLDTPALRGKAFAEISARFAAAGGEDAALAGKVFGADEIARGQRELYLSWTEVAELAASPGVTLGAHSVLHRNLLRLSDEQAEWEMAESRRRIEEELGRRVHHFAYPFGARAHAGPREFQLARKLGFTSAVTTRVANLHLENSRHLQALPRIYGSTIAEVELQLSGAVSALRYFGRRVVSS